MKITKVSISFLSTDGSRRFEDSFSISDDPKLIQIEIEHKEDVYCLTLVYNNKQDVHLLPKKSTYLKYTCISE